MWEEQPMGDGMPYHLEKGPYWSVAESVVNSDRQTRIDILTGLRGGADMLDTTGIGWTLTSTTLRRPGEETQDVVDHGQEWMSNANFQNYTGDVKGILRMTFRKAIEVSLGVDDAGDPTQTTRFWPIEYFWKCPTGWVEGWVTWQADSASSQKGHVTVHLLTPAHGHAVLTDPLAGRNPTQNPSQNGCRYGMWLITHTHHEKTVTVTTDNSEFAIWSGLQLAPVYAGQGPVIAVAPSEGDGGVQCDGRAFAAPA